MANKNNQAQEDNLFRQTFADISPLKQDKITLKRPQTKQKQSFSPVNNAVKQASASFQFSDAFEAHFPETGPLKYVKPGIDSYEVKKLRRGEYTPELILDLHGVKREEAKLELAALIYTAQKQHIHCVCVVHGIGGYVLKQAVPSYLVQHPAVIGFHQAPLNGAATAPC